MKRIVLAILLLIAILPASLVGMQLLERDEQATAATSTDTTLSPSQQIARGAYLARAGDCMACHTLRGGAAYAGGRAITSSFGTFYTPNITADKSTGIGNWSAQDFWRALHHGRGKDGSFLYPAFPFTNYTKITRNDADALFAYLQTVTPVQQANREHVLRFPYNHRILLAFWRSLYFTPGSYRNEPAQSAQWNRGAYLVQGLGHCSACHTARNAFGASIDKSELTGGLIPVMNWYAPSLIADGQAGLSHWEVEDMTALLKTGVSPRKAVFGPMAEVVKESLQHLSEQDIEAMAIYLKSLPQTATTADKESPQPDKFNADRIMQTGSKLYEKHCAACHQANGQGMPPAYPPLTDNGALTKDAAVNPIRMVLHGGFPPSTTGNPRPYGMPPFGQELNDQELATVVSYIRNSWGNQAGFVTPQEVNRYRTLPSD